MDLCVKTRRLLRKTLLDVLIGLIGMGGVALAQAADQAAPQPQETAQAQAPAAPIADSAAPAATAVKGSKKDKKAKKVKVKKEKPPKKVPVNIVQGTLTIDGWTGKARLNYDIADFKYLYMWTPGVGTIVISNEKFPLGTEQKNAFAGGTLTVQENGHTVQLSSDKPLLKSKKPVSAWVFVDTGYTLPSQYPTLGYGDTVKSPYVWPAAKDVKVNAGIAPPPPLPKGLQPTVMKSTGCAPASASVAGSQTAAAPCPAPAVAPANKPAPTPASSSPVASATDAN